MRTLMMLAAASIMTGCTGSEPEWTRDRQDSVTTRYYSGISPDKAIDASERLLRLAGPKQVSFDFRPNGFVAERTVFGYFVIGAINTTYIFDVQAEPAGAGSKVTMRAFQRDATATTMGIIPSGGGLNKAEGLYQLWFTRLDYLLGKSSDWVSCDEAQNVIGTRSFHFEPLCLIANDNHPE